MSAAKKQGRARSVPWLKTPLHVFAELAKLDVDPAFLWHTLQGAQAIGDSRTIEARDIPGAIGRRLQGKRLQAALDELVRAGLLTVKGDVYEQVEWHQIPGEVWSDPVLYERDQRRKRLTRDKRLTDDVKARDANCCRYCAVRVRWGSQTARDGGTYDHVDPDGDNSLDNVVVACRTCNGRKKDRTPEQAGMVLLPVPAEPHADPAEPGSAGDARGVSPGRAPLVRARDSGPSRAGADPGLSRAEPVGPRRLSAVQDEDDRLASLIDSEVAQSG